MEEGENKWGLVVQDTGENMREDKFRFCVNAQTVRRQRDVSSFQDKYVKNPTVPRVHRVFFTLQHTCPLQTDSGKYYAAIILFTTTWNIPQLQQWKVDSSAKWGGSDDAGSCQTDSRQPKFHMFLLPLHRQEDVCFPLSPGVNQGINMKVLK